MRRWLVGIATIVVVVAMLVSSTLVAAARPAGAAVRGARPSWARAARPIRSVRPDSTVSFLVLLGWRDPAGVAALARAVSDPRSSSYARFLSPAEFRARFSVSRADRMAVASWLRDAGLTVERGPASRLWIAARGTARIVESALQIGLAMYRTPDGLRRAPTSDPRVPSDLAGIVKGFVGLSDVRMHPASTSRPPLPPGYRGAKPCSAYWGEKVASDLPPAYGSPVTYDVCGYTPQQLQSAYGFSNAIASGIDGSGQTVAIVDAFASPTMKRDISIYSRRHGLPAPNYTQEVVPATPGSKLENMQGWWGEEALDVDAVHSMAPGAAIHYEGAADNSGRGLLERVGHVVDGGFAQLITNSYGTTGEKIAPNGVAAWEAVFQQAAAEGIGISFSSGDCSDERDPAGLCGGAGYVTADYSASSAWVTAVGGTSLAVGATGEYLWETGWGTATASLRRNGWGPLPGAYLYGSGGGTSLIAAEPSYQQGVVPEALSERWNMENRVVPDVAVVGDPNTGFLVGQTQAFPRGNAYGEARYGGTSLSSPLFAGIMALANQAAGHAHGFVNPLLYSLAGSAAFRDVAPASGPIASIRVAYVNGLNPKDGVDYALRTYDRTQSLATTAGYDDVTGLGSPNGEAFLQALA